MRDSTRRHHLARLGEVARHLDRLHEERRMLAVRLVRAGVAQAVVARACGVNRSTVHRWHRASPSGPAAGPG